MNKMNNNSNKDIQKSNKKSDEYRSLNAAKEKLPFLKNLTDISQPDQESLDFCFCRQCRQQDWYRTLPY